MKSLRLFALMVTVANGTGPGTANAQGMLVGAGGISCTQIVNDDSTHRDAINWLIGYLFARDLEGSAAGEAGYALRNRTSEDLLALLINTCRAHPTFKLDRAAIELHWQLRARTR